MKIFIDIKEKFSQSLVLGKENHVELLINIHTITQKTSTYLLHFFIGAFVLIFLFILVIIAPVNFVNKIVNWSAPNISGGTFPVMDSINTQKYFQQVQKELRSVQKQLSSYSPVRPYIIINTTNNTFQLFKGNELVREGRCSTGSYVKLQGRDQEWIFKTPKGYQTIRGKTTNPVWKKPDWAFVEEGITIPTPNHHSRFEYGVLGEYALYMGDGYMIHGTLYQRLLGLPVTHGCIRLGDDDLETVYKTLGVNSKVFIL